MQKVKMVIRSFIRWLDRVTDEWEPLERVMSVELEAELQLHPGKWVAAHDERIIAIGDTPSEVCEAAWAAGVETPLLLKVPEPGVIHILSFAQA